ncbi:hypothetical protein EJB05_11435, partial [Eragrostis curvula]
MASPPVSSSSSSIVRLAPTPPGSDVSNNTRGSVLLDMDCHIANLPNATTATGTTSTGLRIEVTLHTANPPIASRLCVHCPSLEFGYYTPKLVATDANLVLFYVFVYPNGMVTSHGCDYFVYRPGPDVDRRLDLLPNPFPKYLNYCSIAFISRDGGSSYVVASLGMEQPVFNGDDVIISLDFDVLLYDSESKRWTTKRLPVPDLRRDEVAPLPDAMDVRLYQETHKAITIGGERGTVAWVDLWRGVLLCDVLAECPVLHDIPLPLPSKANWGYFLRQYDPRYIRDVAIHRHSNSIKYIEVERQSPGMQHNNNSSSGLQTTHYGWKAAMWSMPLTTGCSSTAAWQRDCEFDADDNTLSSCSTGGMLQGLSVACPTISMDGDVVYFRSTSRSGCRDESEMLLAIDMRKGTLQAAAELDVQIKNLFIRTFCTSEICRYLGSQN